MRQLATCSKEPVARRRTCKLLGLALILLALALALPAGASVFISSGAGWGAQISGSDAYLYGVAFTDATHGWTVGESKRNGAYAPVVLVTRNGGATWKAQDAGTASGGAGLLSVAFVDAAHGWAAGVNETAVTPVILATSDGGATWEAQDASSAGSIGEIDSLAFVDAAHGWASGWASGFDASNKTLTPVILTTSK